MSPEKKSGTFAHSGTFDRETIRVANRERRVLRCESPGCCGVLYVECADFRVRGRFRRLTQLKCFSCGRAIRRKQTDPGFPDRTEITTYLTGDTLEEMGLDPLSVSVIHSGWSGVVYAVDDPES